MNNLEDVIWKLPQSVASKTDVKTLTMVSSLFGSNSPLKGTKCGGLGKQLKPYLIIAILFSLFSIPQLDMLMGKATSSVPAKMFFKSFLFIVVVYILVNIFAKP